MSGLVMKDLAEQLGVEVVDGQLRWRVVGEIGQCGKWRSREASPAEVLLWDGLRAMAMMRAGAEADETTARQLMDGARRDLLAERSMPRLTPKGGDRGEFARQVRRLAQLGLQKVDDAVERKHPDDYHVAAGGVAMANRVLVMLGEQPVLGAEVGHEAVDRKELVDALTRARGSVAQWIPTVGAESQQGLRDQVLLLDRMMGLLAGDLAVDEHGHWVDVPAREVSS